jgi:hypothetical protein
MYLDTRKLEALFEGLRTESARDCFDGLFLGNKPRREVTLNDLDNLIKDLDTLAQSGHHQYTTYAAFLCGCAKSYRNFFLNENLFG